LHLAPAPATGMPADGRGGRHVKNLMRTFGAALFGAALALMVSHVCAWAEQTSKLSPGDQKIAQALFEAQGTPKSGSPLTLQQIVAMKKSHEGWGEVFKDMKSKGLVTQKNLGQVVSDFDKKHPEMAKIDTKPDKSDKPDKADKMDRPDKPG